MKKRLELAVLATMMLGLASTAAAQQSATSGMQKGLAGLFSSTKEDELIEPDQAFQMKVSVKGPNTLVAELLPAKGYYLYREKIRFTIKDTSGVAINAVKLPTGEMKTDQIFGRTEVYRRAVPVEIALNRTPMANRITLVASYQGCHEKLGVCYPPIDKTVSIVLQ